MTFRLSSSFSPNICLLIYTTCPPLKQASRCWWLHISSSLVGHSAQLMRAVDCGPPTTAISLKPSFHLLFMAWWKQRGGNVFSCLFSPFPPPSKPTLKSTPSMSQLALNTKLAIVNRAKKTVLTNKGKFTSSHQSKRKSKHLNGSTLEISL